MERSRRSGLLSRPHLLEGLEQSRLYYTILIFYHMILYCII